MTRHTTFFIIAIAAVMTGCASRRVTTAPAPLSPAVSVRQVERHVTVYDTVPVLLPQESITIFNTPDTCSHLETSVAESDAWLTPDGRLCHTLNNKPSLPLILPHDTVRLSHDSIRFEPYPVEVIKEVPRDLPFLQKLLMTCGLLFLLLLLWKFLDIIRFIRNPHNLMP